MAENRNTEKSETENAQTKLFTDWRLIVIITLATLLYCLSLKNDIVRDDHIHRAFINGFSIMPGMKVDAKPSFTETVLSLFSFTDLNLGDNADSLTVAQAALEWGGVPWWSNPDLKINFFRPVAAATHWLDYRFWPNQTWLMHLENVILHCLILLCLCVIFKKQRFGNGVILVALTLYGFDVAHSQSVFWIANRNILLATVFGLVAFRFFQLWVEQGRLWHCLAFVVLFLMTLLSAEGGIGLLGILGAYLLVIDKGSLIKKTVLGLFILAVVAIWRIAYVLLGYGASGNGMYLDPIRDFNGFLHSLAINWPILLFEQISGIESLSFMWSDQALPLLVLFSLVFLACCVWIWLPLLRSRPLALFWLLAAAIATIPVCAVTITGSRAMYLAGVGIVLVLALFLHGLFRGADWVPQSKGYRIAAWSLAVILIAGHSVGNAGGWLVMASKALQFKNVMFNKSLKPIELAASADSTVVVINAQIQFNFIYAPSIAAENNVVLPKAVRALMNRVVPMTVSRTSADSLTLATNHYFPLSPDVSIPGSGPFYDLTYLRKRGDDIFLAYPSRYQVGQRFEVPGLIVTIKEISDNGMPKRIHYQFSKNLDSSDYQWLFWDNANKGYETWIVPKVGDVVEIAGPFG